MNNLAVLCAALLVAACHLAKAYDFQDADFNQILSSELQDVLDSLDSIPLHPRTRRDEEAAAGNDEKCRKRYRRPQLCCAQEAVENFHEKERDIMKDCYKEITGVERPDKREHGHHKKFDLFSCEEVEKRKNDMICISECLGKKKGMIAEDGSPQADRIIASLKEKFSKEEWFDSAVEQIVAKCVADGKNSTANPVKFYTEGLKSCNPAAITLKHCLYKEVQLSCPLDQIKDKAACDRFRERLQKGIDVYSSSHSSPFDGPKDE